MDSSKEEEREAIHALNAVHARLDRLEKKIDRLCDLLDEEGMLSQASHRMVQHIDFVEAVYETVRYPLSFVCAKVRALVGRETASDGPCFGEQSLPKLDIHRSGLITTTYDEI